jgi:hypothetical protein
LIWESRPWKYEVARLAKALEKRKMQRRWTQHSFSKLEREVFFAAYAVRKLIDSFKISDEVEAYSLSTKIYSRRDRVPDLSNRGRINELYDFSNPKSSSMGLRDFCDQVIHSFIFELCTKEDNGGLEGLFIAADRQKDKSLLYFDIDIIISALVSIASDDIVSIEWRRDCIGGPLRMIKKSSKYPSIRNP